MRLITVLLTFFIFQTAMAQDACTEIDSLLEKRRYLVDSDLLEIEVEEVLPEHYILKKALGTSAWLATATSASAFFQSFRKNKDTEKIMTELLEFLHHSADLDFATRETFLQELRQKYNIPKGSFNAQDKRVTQLFKANEELLEKSRILKQKYSSKYKDILVNRNKLTKNFIKGASKPGLKGTAKSSFKLAGKSLKGIAHSNKFAVVMAAVAGALYLGYEYVDEIVQDETEALSFRKNIISVLSAYTWEERVAICDDIAKDKNYRKQINDIDNILHQMILGLEDGNKNELEIGMSQIDSSLTRENLKYHPKTETEKSYYELYIKKAVVKE